MKQSVLFMLFLFLCHQIPAQNLTQVLKGKVQDESSGLPIPFATIMVKNTLPILGTISGSDGLYILKNVPVGRYDIEIRCIGYEPALIREVLITTGKQAEENISLREAILSIDEIEIKPKTNKEQPLNQMALVSSRMLSVEEAKRYAGGFDDPARLASSFAGVASNIGNNGIIVRGNAPHMLSWRLEGVEIPNPNHFADMSAFGAGGITALSSQLLANSDFYTGAFPAEYGNATSGVFDIFMRNGNFSHREHTFQIGLIGLDFASEGPFSKKRNSLYLLNYRYSTLSLVTPLLPADAEGTNYQDLAFKLNFPTKKTGTFSLWGIGLKDRSGSVAETEPALWNYHQDRQTQDVNQYMGACGLSHKLFLGNSTCLQTTLATNGSGLDLVTDEYIHPGQYFRKDQIRNFSQNFVLTGFLNHKFSNVHTNRTGYIITLLNYDLLIKNAQNPESLLQTTVNQSGRSLFLSGYTSSQLRFSQDLTTTIGIHLQCFLLNRNFTLEPRGALKWQINNANSAGLAFGSHSRLERLNIYFIQDKNGMPVNGNLGFSKAHHLVLNYDWSVLKNTRLKLEPYYQWLTNLPVSPDNSFALINQKDDWFISQPLSNKGKGRNLGIDLTLEQFINNGFYYLITASVFDSKYRGGDGIWRNTRYNRNYLINLLTGKEWKTGKQKQNIFSLNGRLSFQGGDRIIPVDYIASEIENEIVLNENLAFRDKLDPTLVFHFTSNYRINKSRYTSTWSLQVINATGVKEFYGFRRNLKTGTIEANKEAIVVPNISYKIEF